MSTPHGAQIGSLEHASDYSDPTNVRDGRLILTCIDSSYKLRWIPYISNSGYDSTYIMEEAIEESKSDWGYGKQFFIDQSVITNMTITENPLKISFYCKNKNTFRTFLVQKNDEISFILLLESLLSLRLAVPSHLEEFSFEFYEKATFNPNYYVPIHLYLPLEEFSSLSELWEKVCHYYQSLLTYQHHSGTLPNDPSYPLSSAVRTFQKSIMEKITSEINLKEMEEPVTAENLEQIYDEDGRIVDFDSLKKRLFACGAETEVLKKLLPFLVGLYQPSSTREEREKILKTFERDFNSLLFQLQNITQTQLEGEFRKQSAFRVIGQDVLRTDRHHKAFSNTEGKGLEMLSTFLRAFALFNPQISYLQGMNDLFVPLMLTFFPEWDDNGSPICEGKPEDQMPLIFFTFEAMIKTTNHIQLLADVTGECKRQANAVFTLLQKVSPLTAIWIERNNLKEFLWLYSDFVLMFKRTFDKIWPVWIQFLTGPSPKLWIRYFVTALIMATFDSIATLPDVSIAAMMEAFPRIVQTVSSEDLGRIALWISEKFPPEEVPEEPCPELPLNYKFFEADCTASAVQIAKSREIGRAPGSSSL